jgi:hypothetical protein
MTKFELMMLGIDIVDGISDAALAGSMIHEGYVEEGAALMLVSTFAILACVWARNVNAKTPAENDGGDPKMLQNVVYVLVCAFMSEVGTAGACMFSVFSKKVAAGKAVRANDEGFVLFSLGATAVAGAFFFLQVCYCSTKYAIRETNGDKDGDQVVVFFALLMCALVGGGLFFVGHTSLALMRFDYMGDDDTPLGYDGNQESGGFPDQDDGQDDDFDIFSYMKIGQGAPYIKLGHVVFVTGLFGLGLLCGMLNLFIIEVW